ncbi:MAG: hypothetical protein AAGD43_27160 [Pseudomonadota bacterium]
MSPSSVSLDANPLRIILALVFGAMLGGALLSAHYSISLYQILGAGHFAEYGISKTLGVFVLASGVWFFCLLVFGGPCWYILHQNGCRSWSSALKAGTIVPFVALLAINTNLFTGVSLVRQSSSVHGVWHWHEGYMTTAGWLNALELSTIFAIQGGVIALLIWRVAYSRVS